jgi:hypothetical protein
MVCNLMKKANPVWQVILGLSRYPFFNHRTRRTHGNKSSHCYAMLPCVRCIPWFPDLRRQERISVVAAPQYRAAANTAMGWKTSNLRTEMTRLLRHADFSGSPDVATCRQTVEPLLAPLSTAWQRMATMRKQTMRVPGRSHLSPDGRAATRAAVHRLAADGYDSKADDARPRT